VINYLFQYLTRSPVGRHDSLPQDVATQRYLAVSLVLYMALALNARCIIAKNLLNFPKNIIVLQKWKTWIHPLLRNYVK